MKSMAITIQFLPSSFFLISPQPIHARTHAHVSGLSLSLSLSLSHTHTHTYTHTHILTLYDDYQLYAGDGGVLTASK